VRHALGIDSGFSAQSMLWIGIFAVVFVAAVLTDLAALLQYAGLVGGLPARILEAGGIITGIAIFPLIVMGLSISHDLNHKR
jgi:hypothetical protein